MDWIALVWFSTHTHTHKRWILISWKVKNWNLGGWPSTPAQNHCLCHSRRITATVTDLDWACCFRTHLICSYLLLQHRERVATRMWGRKSSHTAQLQELQPSFIHDQVLSHKPPRFRLGGLCVLFQSSKLLGLGSPLSADHSATLMATWTLKFYSKLPRRSGRWGWRKCLPALALHCRGSRCHSSVTQKTSSSACVTMAFRSLEHNDCWLTWMHSILIEPELIWGFFLCVCVCFPLSWQGNSSVV